MSDIGPELIARMRASYRKRATPTVNAIIEYLTDEQLALGIKETGAFLGLDPEGVVSFYENLDRHAEDFAKLWIV